MDHRLAGEMMGEGAEPCVGPRVRLVLRGLRNAEIIGVQANRTFIQYLALISQIVWVGLVCWTVVEAVRGRASGWLVASVVGHTAAEVASRLLCSRSTTPA